MRKSKFYKPIPFKEKIINFTKGLLFWKGRKKGIIYTRNISWDDIRAVFFPNSFHEKYKYLGSVPYNKGNNIFKAIEPIVIFMDYKARPWWCPRFVLRFLHLFGSDNSIVRVRNRTLHNIKNKLTKGYLIYDYKTKWSDYDLRISISGNNQMCNLVDAITQQFYDSGYRNYLADRIKQIDPTTKYHSGYLIESLKEELNKLEENAARLP